MSKQAPPRSVWSRSSRLVALATSLASKELKGRVTRALDRGEALVRQAQQLQVQVEQAREIVASLGQLKGASMKAGQLLSMELRDVLPPEVIEVLSQLQASGATVAFDEIESILREELGAERLSQLSVSPVPLASASIGQVHRATWRAPDGVVREIVLKVQFRGIAETIDSDLALLERIARLFLTVQLKNLELSAVFDELRDVLQRETDYLHEADALERYRALAHQVPGLRVPEVFHALCTRRVLALSYEAGLTLDAFMATTPTLEARHHVTTQVLDLYFREFFDWGLVQTDANFANFLFRPEAGELVLLDFGATREYPAAFRERYRALLTSTLRGDRPGAYAAALELQLISPDEPEATREALHDLLETVLRVFQPAFQPVDFRDKRFVDEAGERLKAYYRALTCSPPPAQLLFLHRKLGGVYSMGRALQARLDLLPFAERLTPGEAPRGPL
jgi:aarF domain-containing kinase